MLTLLASLALAQVAAAALAPASFPTATANVTNAAPITVANGQVYDGGFKRFGRGVNCAGDGKDVEGGTNDAVFIVQGNGTVKNVIIGADAIEGIHCQGSCTIESVFWENVCEDALSIVGSANRTVTVRTSAARGAIDKVIQHNSPGIINVDGFSVSNFGKLYRSCGNCGTQYTRKVNLANIVARGGGVLAGVNSNYGDVVTLSNIDTDLPNKLCEIWTGNNNGAEPTKTGSGPNGVSCIVSTATTPSQTPTASASRSPTASPSRSPSRSPTASVSRAPTVVASPIVSPSRSPTGAVSPSPSSSISPPGGDDIQPTNPDDAPEASPSPGEDTPTPETPDTPETETPPETDTPPETEDDPVDSEPIEDSDSIKSSASGVEKMGVGMVIVMLLNMMM